MSRYIYYCANCNSTYKGEEGKIDEKLECPECKTVTIPTRVELEDWRSKTSNEKEELKKYFKTIKAENITTCEKIENREIESYLGIVYSTGIYIVGGLLGGGLVNQEILFGTEYDRAMNRMYQKAILLGGNAVIGMQTALTSAANYIILTVSGTAVKLKDI